MHRTQDIQIKRDKEETNISHCSPGGLLPRNQTLVINLETRTVSLLSDGHTLIEQQQLSISELRLLVPMLDSFPHYCPFDLLLSHLTTQVVTSASFVLSLQRLW